MLSLERFENREKERSDMMKIGNGNFDPSLSFTIRIRGRDDAIVIITHIEKIRAKSIDIITQVPMGYAIYRDMKF